MVNLYLHRVEAVERDGKIVLERVPENPKQENCGVKYRVAIRKTDETRAVCYGWETGYPSGDFTQGSCGTVYAPKGFKRGELAFVDIDDELLSASKRNNPSLDAFLANLNRADVDRTVDRLQGFSLMGEILY